MPGFIGVPELLLLALVVLFMFGSRRLPALGRAFGDGARQLKRSVHRYHETGMDDIVDPPHRAAATSLPASSDEDVRMAQSPTDRAARNVAEGGPARP